MMMKGCINGITLFTFLLTLGALGQAPQTGNQAAAQVAGQAASQATASTAKQIDVAANTQITAVLESTVDARKAEPGDEVKARVTKDVKQGEQIVVRKGDRLLGKIIAAEGSGTANAGSQLAVQFDRLQSGQATTQLHTVVTAVLSAAAGQNEPSLGRDAAEPTMPMPQQPAPSGSASGTGGVLGGVGSSVDSTLGVVGSITGGTGGVLGATADSTLGTTVNASTSTPARAIRMESQSSASQTTDLNSVFSTSQGNLRLDSGTALQFRVVDEKEKRALPSTQ